MIHDTLKSYEVSGELAFGTVSVAEAVSTVSMFERCEVNTEILKSCHFTLER